MYEPMATMLYCDQAQRMLAALENDQNLYPSICLVLLIYELFTFWDQRDKDKK